MKKYVVHYSEYMQDPADMRIFEASNNTEALKEILNWSEAKEDDEEANWPAFLETCCESNGDGQPYIMVFCVEDEEVIYGAY